MSSNFDAMLKADAGFILSAAGELAEAIVYTPRGGSPRTIYAIVRRHSPTRPREVRRGAMPKMTIECQNHSTNGIDAATLDTGGDTVTLAYAIGGTAEAFSLSQKPVMQNAALLRFEVF